MDDCLQINHCLTITPIKKDDHTEKPMNTNSMPRIVFRLHTAVYFFTWLITIVSLIVHPGNMYGANLIFILALWGVPLSIHAFIYSRESGYKQALRDERQTYREGFADAVQELKNLQGGRIPSHLMDDSFIGEDGELYEAAPKQKRHY
jgi:hypothetical protein